MIRGGRKKIDTWKIRDQRIDKLVDVPVSVHRPEGDRENFSFSALLPSMRMVEAASLDELYAMICEILADTENIIWKPHYLISWARDDWGSSSDECTSMGLSFYVRAVELGHRKNRSKVHRNKGSRYIERGWPNRSGDNACNLVPVTPEATAVVEAITAGLLDLDKKMTELLQMKPEKMVATIMQRMPADSRKVVRRSTQRAGLRPRLDCALP